jgi:hypothetical protein
VFLPSNHLLSNAVGFTSTRTSVKRTSEVADRSDIPSQYRRCGSEDIEAKLRSQRLELYACRAKDNLDIFTGKADRTAAEIAFDIQVTRRKVEDGLMMGIFKSP